MTDDRCTTYDVRRTTYDVRRTTYDVRRTMYEVRHAMRLFGVSEHCSTGKENRTAGATTTALEARIRLNAFEYIIQVFCIMHYTGILYFFLCH